MRNFMKNSSGFTLIEVVIALGILGFGILTMFTMQAFGIKGNRIANTITQQVSMGVNAAELIMAKPLEDKKNKSTKKTLQDSAYMQSAISNTVDASRFTITWKAPVLDDPVEGVMLVEVEMKSNIDNRKVNLVVTRVNMDDL